MCWDVVILSHFQVSQFLDLLFNTNTRYANHLFTLIPSDVIMNNPKIVFIAVCFYKLWILSYFSLKYHYNRKSALFSNSSLNLPRVVLCLFKSSNIYLRIFKWTIVWPNYMFFPWLPFNSSLDDQTEKTNCSALQKIVMFTLALVIFADCQ